VTDFTIYSMALSGTDVYVADSGQNPVAGYWKNNTWVGLPLSGGATSGTVTAIGVSGSTVYAAGSNGSVSGYWEGTTWNALALPAGKTGANVNAVTISGTNVFLAGGVSDANGFYPGYWLNGAWTSLPEPAGFVSGTVLGLAQSGSTLYAAGWGPLVSGNYTDATVGQAYWLNGTVENTLALPTGAVGASANGLALSGTDVYVGGTVTAPSTGGNDLTVPGYWLDGSWKALALPTGQTQGQVNAIVVQ
jgi:hypothetical protein